ncbi:hypothetical protein BH18CHL2_BH18CHL2_06140 [soil metagenome]
MPAAVALGSVLEADLRVGLLALAVAPAELAAPALVRVLGGRSDVAGAFLAGTVVASFVLALAFLGPLAPAALGPLRSASLAFIAGMAFAGAAPALRDRLLVVLRRAGDLALVVLVAIAALGAFPAFSAATILLTGAVLGGGAAAAFVAARLGGADARSAIVASGTRDFAVAASIASTARADAAALPLTYGALLLVSAALVAVRRSKAGRM